MCDTIEFHNIVWDHTLEMTKWNFLLGKTPDEVLRDNLNPFLSTDSEQQHIIDYTPFQIEEHHLQSNLNHIEPEYSYDEYTDQIEDDLSSSDDDEDEYFEFD